MRSKKIKNFSGRNFKKERTEDKIAESRRSALMSKIRSKKTAFENQFIASIKSNTRLPFQTNVSSIRGKPDVVFFGKKTCIFLDSDFWHGWQYPRWRHLLKNDFWRNKIYSNRLRDRRTTAYLRRNGWTVIRLWEHKIKKKQSSAIDAILNAIK